MIDITLKFNSYDFSGLLSTYTVRHIVEKAASVTTMDGEEHIASRIRPVVEFSLIPMADDVADDVYDALSVITAETEYSDPFTATDRLVVMRVDSDLDAAFALKSIDGKRYYKGGTIVLRQKGVM